MRDENGFMSLHDEIKAALTLADEADRVCAELEAKRTVTRSASDMGLIYKVRDNALIDTPAPAVSSFATQSYVQQGLGSLVDIVGEEVGRIRRELEAKIATLERLVAGNKSH